MATWYYICLSSLSPSVFLSFFLSFFLSLFLSLSLSLSKSGPESSPFLLPVWLPAAVSWIFCGHSWFEQMFEWLYTLCALRNSGASNGTQKIDKLIGYQCHTLCSFFLRSFRLSFAIVR